MSKLPTMRIVDMLQIYCATEGISLRDLEKATGVDHNSIHRFMTGHAITHENFVRILGWVLDSVDQT